MAGYTKLWSSIVHSTIWRANNETRLLWITMLALCDQHGEVMASIPGLADAARISVADCERGLELLAAPDPYSRTPDHEGKRIEPIRGGWAVLNHGLYRDLLSIENKRATEAERKRRYRNKTKDCPEMSHAVPQCPGESRQAEAEADTNTKKNTPLTPQGGKRKRSKESLFVVDQEGDEAAKHWYAFCVQNYPTKDKGNNRAKNAHEERTINRDSVQAQANFKAILDSGKATARELASCVDVASQRWAKDLGYEYQFIPNLSTYFGPEKSLWLNDLATARRQLEQIDQREDTV